MRHSAERAPNDGVVPSERDGGRRLTRRPEPMPDGDDEKAGRDRQARSVIRTMPARITPSDSKPAATWPKRTPKIVLATVRTPINQLMTGFPTCDEREMP